MAAANVITAATAQTTSADVVVTANTVIALKAAGGAVPGDAKAVIYLKDDGGLYQYFGTLTAASPFLILTPSTYRAVKPASPSAYGVFTSV